MTDFKITYYFALYCENYQYLLILFYAYYTNKIIKIKATNTNPISTTLWIIIVIVICSTIGLVIITVIIYKLIIYLKERRALKSFEFVAGINTVDSKEPQEPSTINN